MDHPSISVILEVPANSQLPTLILALENLTNLAHAVACMSKCERCQLHVVLWLGLISTLPILQGLLFTSCHCNAHIFLSIVAGLPNANNSTAVLEEERVEDQTAHPAVAVCERMNIDELMAVLTRKQYWIDLALFCSCFDVIFNMGLFDDFLREILALDTHFLNHEPCCLGVLDDLSTTSKNCLGVAFGDVFRDFFALEDCFAKLQRDIDTTTSYLDHIGPIDHTSEFAGEVLIKSGLLILRPAQLICYIRGVLAQFMVKLVRSFLKNIVIFEIGGFALPLFL
ncbi:hypothetical protein HG530_004143 [Fusarium avenaceum]|nr:hypothetical protein HG530_004143 [Fusarium avenaceum]